MVLQVIRSMVASDTPIIFAGNWRAEHKKGWRHVKNFDNRHQAQIKSMITYLISAHGKDNVAVGQPFLGNLAPSPDPHRVGIYVKDVEIQVEALMRELDSYNQNC